MSTERMPMFPLGSNVFPMQILPLHIFEERYRTLMDDLFPNPDEPTEPPSFGVVLIERGRETGGGDVRANVATRVEVLEAERFDDGRWGVIVAGVERLDVVAWHDDDPYPLADVTPRERVDNGGGPLDEVERLLAEALEIGAQLTESDPVDLSRLSEEPLARLDQMSAVAPLTTFDRQQVLEAPSTGRQIELLQAALIDKAQLLRSELDRRASE